MASHANPCEFNVIVFQDHSLIEFFFEQRPVEESGIGKNMQQYNIL